jgi:sugar lactone lactonase YvrE
MMRHFPTCCAVLLSLGSAGHAARAQIRDAPNPSPPPPGLTAPARLQLVAQFPDRQITGIAVSGTGRIFVTLPRWTQDVPVSVGELKNGEIVPYPDQGWNDWRRGKPLSPKDHFVCVQSVVADGTGALWVLDPAAPGLRGPVKDGPKLVEIDLKTNKIAKVFSFDEAVAPPGSYLNDIRFSPDGKFGYISDSGAKGALVVIDLTSGAARRVLDGDRSTQADPGVTVRTDGKELQLRDGHALAVGVDGIAASGDGKFVYYQALTGKTLYRIASAALQNRALTPAQLSAKVETVQASHPADGLWIDSLGRLYVSNPQRNSIETAMPGSALTPLATDPRLRWPDSFAQGPGGTLYVTASHIQDSPWFDPDAKATPSAIFRVVQ